MLNNKNFNLLYDLPKPILIKGVDLLFEKHKMYDILTSFSNARKNSKYKIIRSRQGKTIMINYCTYGKGINLPDVVITNYNNHYAGSFYTHEFIKDGSTLYLNKDRTTESLFNDYYDICVGLNRQLAIDNILK
jgi:hypothetical protein